MPKPSGSFQGFSNSTYFFSNFPLNIKLESQYFNNKPTRQELHFKQHVLEEVWFILELLPAMTYNEGYYINEVFTVA